MDSTLRNQLQSLKFGEVQQFKNIAILPLLSPADGVCQYRTLNEALTAQDVSVAEISDAGSVPQLLLTNRANRPVLLIDGEELAGAKQNRVLNTTILVKENCETRIPVSCTEQGRWSYQSKLFQESGNVMAYKSRSRKARSVQCSLENSGAYDSNQGEVWAEISALHAKAGTHSPTSAMSDVFKAREDDLRQCEKAFKPIPDQVGIVAFIDGRPVGVDLLSLRSAYAQLHPKLIRSYALEGLIESREAPATKGFAEQAADFLTDIKAAEERQFPSLGHGVDLRYRSGPQSSTSGSQLGLTGSALLHEGEVIHAAFFQLEESAQPSASLAALRSRRRFV